MSSATIHNMQTDEKGKKLRINKIIQIYVRRHAQQRFKAFCDKYNVQCDQTEFQIDIKAIKEMDLESIFRDESRVSTVSCASSEPSSVQISSESQDMSVPSSSGALPSFNPFLRFNHFNGNSSITAVPPTSMPANAVSNRVYPYAVHYGAYRGIRGSGHCMSMYRNDPYRNGLYPMYHPNDPMMCNNENPDRFRPNQSEGVSLSTNWTGLETGGITGNDGMQYHGVDGQSQYSWNPHTELNRLSSTNEVRAPTVTTFHDLFGDTESTHSTALMAISNHHRGNTSSSVFDIPYDGNTIMSYNGGDVVNQYNDGLVPNELWL